MMAASGNSVHDILFISGTPEKKDLFPCSPGGPPGTKYAPRMSILCLIVPFCKGKGDREKRNMEGEKGMLGRQYNRHPNAQMQAAPLGAACGFARNAPWTTAIWAPACRSCGGRDGRGRPQCGRCPPIGR